MADSPKRPADVSQENASRVVKPVRPPGSPSAETARAADSVPVPVGPFSKLPMQFGRYEIRKELGRGQMGAVYLAYDTKLDRLVALKVARVSSSGSANLLKRMEIEAKSAAKVDHPHICKVYDAGEIDGIRFIALQYVEGEDLKKYMKRLGRKREPVEAIRFIIQILRALEAAHEKGVIHRDLKPENVMLNKKNEPVIMDFGLARRTIASSDAGLTQGMIVGTAAYMSPEQAVGKAEGIDHRSDLYAVGVMLFEMLTGEWPFTGGAIEVMGKKCVQEPPSPLSLNPNLNPQLAAVCHKMIAKQKGDRYVTCAEVMSAMEAIDLQAAVRPAPLIDAIESEPNFDFLKESPVASSIRKSSSNVVATNPGERKTKKTHQKSASGILGPLMKWWNAQMPGKRWMTVSAAALFVLLPAIMWWLYSSSGVVQIVIDDPTLSVRFQGTSITADNDSQAIRVWPSSKNKLEVFQNGTLVESATTELTLTKGERRRVKVSLVDSQEVVVAVHSSKKASTEEPPWIGLLPQITSKSTGMQFALIPAGEFEMGAPVSEVGRSGDEGPQHTVRITQSFYLGVFEVTQGEYQKVMEVNPSNFSLGGGGKKNVIGQDTNRIPVVGVSWLDAVEFCNRLSEREGRHPYYQLTNILRKNGAIDIATVTISGGTGYRLPTEAEWEFACRANTTTPFAFGSNSNGEQANLDGRFPYGTSKAGPDLQSPTSVGSYAKNEFGLFDMHGNVSEWCEDVFDYHTYSSRSGITENPMYTSTSDIRVARGGSWFSASLHARSAYRSAYSRLSRTDLIGFRVARSTTKVETASQRGGMIELVVPSDLAYGDKGMGSIPANTTLHFEIDLVSVF